MTHPEDMQADEHAYWEWMAEHKRLNDRIAELEQAEAIIKAALVKFKQERDDAQVENAKLRATVDDQAQRLDFMGHVIVECGVTPGEDSPCRCEACKAVAISMDEAGYMEQAEVRWWDEPSPKSSPTNSD